MTLRKFFMSRAIVFGIVIILGLVIFGYKMYFPVVRSDEASKSSMQENTEPPIFVWKYEKDSSLNLDGFPQTNIFLEARYPNEVIQRKLIDTTPGGCNDLPDADKDSVPHSTNIQCYSAGLGYRFKITKGEQSYLVLRKTFEEALPDYNPPVYEYEVVSEFPLFHK